ncbi:hypothetical protein ACQKCJ_14825 [Flavobacterium sp. NPDC079362]|uniref:hypothetical protein n=1 Tax=Flavobacterium sp. NPDC079362 TaxID=3390566 RepID=UPI003D0707DB
MIKDKMIYFLVFVIILLGYLNYFSTYVMPWQKEEAIKSALLWGGLKEIPKNAKIINLEKHGSSFTKQFIIEFTSSKSELEQWIRKSKRLKNNIPKIQLNIRTYEIHPGEINSYGGRVKIKQDTVSINMSWS